MGCIVDAKHATEIAGRFAARFTAVIYVGTSTPVHGLHAHPDAYACDGG